MIDDAFVFDCVAHPFNFDPKNAFGNPGLMFNNHLYAFHNALTPDDQPKLPPEEFLRRVDSVGHPQDGVRGVRHRHAGGDAAAADRPVPRRPVTVGVLRRPGQPRPGPDGLLGIGQPAGGTQGAGPDGAPGRRVQRARVQVLQRPLRLREAVPVADGRPEHRVPHLREGPGTRREPDRRAQGRAARPAADRAHPDLGHGRGGGQLPRHQLRHLPRRAAVPRRDLLAADQVPEPVRVDRGDRQLRGPRASHVRGNPRQAAVLVRRGQDHLRLRGAAVASAVGAARVHGLPDPRGPVRRLRLPAAHRPGQAQDPRREPAPPARPGPRRGEGPTGRQRSPRGSSSGGKSWYATGTSQRRIAAVPTEV